MRYLNGVALDKQLWIMKTFIGGNKNARRKTMAVKKKNQLNLRTRYEFSRIFAMPRKSFL